MDYRNESRNKENENPVRRELSDGGGIRSLMGRNFNFNWVAPLVKHIDEQAKQKAKDTGDISNETAVSEHWINEKGDSVSGSLAIPCYEPDCTMSVTTLIQDSENSSLQKNASKGTQVDSKENLFYNMFKNVIPNTNTSWDAWNKNNTVSYTHLRAHET